MPRDVWRFEVDLSDVADLTVDAVLAAHGIEALAPTHRQWPRTQPIGETYWRAGRAACWHHQRRMPVAACSPYSEQCLGKFLA